MITKASSSEVFDIYCELNKEAAWYDAFLRGGKAILRKLIGEGKPQEAIEYAQKSGLSPDDANRLVRELGKETAGQAVKIAPEILSSIDAVISSLKADGKGLAALLNKPLKSMSVKDMNNYLGNIQESLTTLKTRRKSADELLSIAKRDNYSGPKIVELKQALSNVDQLDGLAVKKVKEVGSSISAKALSESRKQKAKELAKGVGETAKQLGKAVPGAVGVAMPAAKYIAKGTLGFAKLLVRGGVVLVAAAGAWYLFFKESPSKAKQEAEALGFAATGAKENLSSLKFISGSNGEARTKDLISWIDQVIGAASVLGSDSSEEEIASALKVLGNAYEVASEYLADSEKIRGDLEDDSRWSAAIDSLKGLLKVLEECLGSIKDKVGFQPKVEEKEGGKDKRPSITVKVPSWLGVPENKLDVSGGPRYRSAVSGIISKVLSSPEGKAFFDPDNIWGGWLDKTGNNEDDAKRGLRYLYLNQIFNRGDLRKFIRRSMPKVSRNRQSGWKEAVKEYRKSSKEASEKDSLTKISFFTQKFSKPANSDGSCEYKTSNNYFYMKKQADSSSQEFFQSALKGLSDEYARSYYRGFRSLYDQKPEETSPDYQKTYMVHGETGSDLIGAAHPKSVYIADAMGRGGVLENIIEQHNHNRNVAESMPSGNFRGRHAWVVEQLVKLAEEAEQQDLLHASDFIDAALETIVAKFE